MATLGEPERPRVGVMNTPESIAATVASAIALAGGVQHLAVVFEDHSEVPAGKGRTSATLLGMGAARGWWEQQLRISGHPKSRCFKVTMSDWRKRVLHIARRLDTDRLKAAAMLHCERKYRQALIGHDAAEAACILEWALLTRPWEAP